MVNVFGDRRHVIWDGTQMIGVRRHDWLSSCVEGDEDNVLGERDNVPGDERRGIEGQRGGNNLTYLATRKERGDCKRGL